MHSLSFTQQVTLLKFITNHESQPKFLSNLLLVLDHDILLKSSAEKTLEIFKSMVTENFKLGSVNIRFCMC